MSGLASQIRFSRLGQARGASPGSLDQRSEEWPLCEGNFLRCTRIKPLYGLGIASPGLARVRDIVHMVSLYNMYTDTLPPRARLGPPRPSSASGGPPAAARCGGVTNPTSVHRDAIGRSEVQLGAWIARPGLSPGPLNGRLRCRPHEVLFTPVQPFVQQERVVCGWQQTQMTTGCSLVAQRQHCA